ncbi:MAG: zinc ribbon domain-containing protein [Oscillospiraceae bacterium]|nr:zinc ribbon domain-containing protein [Oscillospiraceae bacterium]MDY4192611.1 zinc ribbon domain-containing protein [Oscillospiraceae bacterium]
MEETQNSGQVCPHCGGEAAADSRFCPSCGKELPLPFPDWEEEAGTGFFRRTRLRPFALLGLVGAFFAMILLYLFYGALHLGGDWSRTVSEFFLQNIQGKFAELGIIYHSTGIVLILTGVAQACVGLMCMGFALRCRKTLLRWAGAVAAGALFLQSVLYLLAGAFPRQLLGLIGIGLSGGWVFAAVPLGAEILSCAACIFLAVRIIRSQVNLTISKFAAMIATAFFALAAFNAAVMALMSPAVPVGISGRFFLQLGYLVLAVSALSFEERK